MLDWHTFLKLDNAATIDFLSSYASALATEGLIADRSVENLKISLATVTPQLATTDKSVLTLLAENDAEFLQILTARYGVTGFAWNHMRFSTRNLLSESCATLASWADQTLKKAELFMNRPFVSHALSGQSRRELFPSVLMHAAKSLHDTAKDLKEVLLELSLMRQADVLDTSGEQHECEYRIALQVGFSGLESETLSFCRTELRSIRKIISAFEEMAISIPQIIAGISENTATLPGSKKLEAECEILAADCQRLSGARLNVSTNLNVWETRRLGFLHEIFSLNHQMAQVAKLFSDSVSPKEKLSDLELLTTDLERAISCNLIKRGTGANIASLAAKDFIHYCIQHKTSPATLIAAELKKINHNLHDDTLALASQLASDSFTATPGGSAEKTRFLEAAKKIRKALNVTSPFSVTLGFFICAILFGSCGVKTNVVSEGVDPIPSIPFRGDDTLAKPTQTGASSKASEVKP